MLMGTLYVLHQDMGESRLTNLVTVTVGSSGKGEGTIAGVVIREGGEGEGRVDTGLHCEYTQTILLPTVDQSIMDSVNLDVTI